MAFVLTPEDGAGVTGANTYATVAQGDDYHDGRLNATDWTAADNPTKEKALSQATRTIENAVVFVGYRKAADQALEWPRVQAKREGVNAYTSIPMGGGQSLGPYWPDNVVPPKLVSAVCELARQLIAGTVTMETEGRGIKKVGLGEGAIDVEFDSSDRKNSALPDEVMRMLSELCTVRGMGSAMKTQRV